MIIYGWNSKNIRQAPLEAYECPNCKTKNSHIAIFSNYAHLFWIPLFPYKKSAQIFCTHCQLVQKDKELPGEMKEQVRTLKSSVKSPVYLFAGLIIIVLFAAFIFYSSLQNSQLQQSFIDDPQIGDVYIIEDPDEPTEYNHYLLKVTDILPDSLVVSINTFGYNGVVSSLDAEDGFYDFGYLIHKNRIQGYDDAGELKKVIREYSSFSGFDRIVEYQIPEPDSGE